MSGIRIRLHALENGMCVCVMSIIEHEFAEVTATMFGLIRLCSSTRVIDTIAYVIRCRCG